MPDSGAPKTDLAAFRLENLMEDMIAGVLTGSFGRTILADVLKNLPEEAETVTVTGGFGTGIINVTI